ncbi:MAG: acylphosphatase [Elusimicrobia bacterium]|nr:acylphosphatase [Elusimicrobiota bacterium]
MTEVTAKIIVRGMVQMVGYRYYTLRKAQQLGVSGYVRNLADGSVEVVARTDRATLEELIALLRKGPSSAEVSGLDIDYNYEPEEEPGDFDIRH